MPRVQGEYLLRSEMGIWGLATMKFVLGCFVACRHHI